MPRQKEFEREEVLEKALNIFWQHGYNATSFQQLTEGMCINRQSIYDTYGDKHTLFIEALKHYSDTGRTTRLELFEQDKPVMEILRIFFAQLLKQIHRDADSKGCFLTNASLEMIPHDDEVKKIAAQNMIDLTKDFQTLLARGIKAGELPKTHHAETLAIYLINSINGFNTLGKTVTDKKKLQGIIDITLSAVQH